MRSKCNCGLSNNSQPTSYEGRELTDINNAFQPLRSQKKKVNYLMVFLLMILAYVIMNRLYC